MLDTLQSLDEAALLFCNGYHTEALDSFMMLITGKWIWVPFYCILVGAMFWRCGWKRTIVYLIGIAVVITLADQICASWIRPAVARLRPCAPANPLSAMVQTVNGYCPRSYSFPSCHGANTFALATFISLVFRRRAMTWFMLCWATLVSFSRLYLGVHHPGDIIVGAAIGAAIAWGVWRLCQLVKLGKLSKLGVVAVCLLTGIGCQAQKFEWGGEFATIFDNREGNGKHTKADTYFLTRLAPEIGISFNNGTHRVMAGAVWTQPIGCEWEGHRISPTLYYRYNSEVLHGSLGMFPRTQLVRPLPEYLESDSASYAQHNIRGALLQGCWQNSFFELIVDWKGMRTTTQREAFEIIARGEWQSNSQMLSFIAGGDVMLNHLAKVRNAPADQYVIDNLIFNPYVGLDFMPLLKPYHHWADLSLRVGLLASTTRDRGDNQWLSAAGVRAEVNATLWRLTLRNITWCGNNPLFPLYNRFSNQLNNGEPYYASKWYNRTELSGLIIRYKNIVDLHAELDFHVADNNDFMFYQRLILTVKI